MTRDNLRDTYSRRSSKFELRARRHARLMGYLSLARLFALIGIIWFIVLGVKHHQPLFYGASALTAALFLFLVGRFNRQKDIRELNIRLKQLNDRETQCLLHNYQQLPDGQEFADPSHPWSHDLDIFGKGSLYQYLNRTTTLKGSELLAGLLTSEPDGPAEILQRQGIIAEMKEQIDFRQTFTARGSMIDEETGDLQGIETWRSARSYIVNHRWLFYLAMVMSAISIGIIAWGFFDLSRFWYLLPVLLFNFSLLSPFLGRTNLYQQTISKKHDLLEGYALLLSIIAGTPFEHAQLKQMGVKAREGMKKVRQLSRLLNIFDQRLNMLLGAVFNGLFLFDFIMLFLLERWKSRNREKIMEWIGITGWSDALISLSGFAYNHPGYTVPVLVSDQNSLELKGLGHPLIPDSKRVVNSISIALEKVVIITGANMAGKSTFLRSLGINTVLAYAGCPVCATRFSTQFSGLFSSMRTADSLADEESYFLAEIKKLQRIVKRMEEGGPLLILLDEVLKGTNTTDKKLGSVGLIKRSLPYPVRFFIATHDLSLGALEKELSGQVVNYCFESYIRELQLEFDYTLRKGIATNMNASFLMKQMGIMD